jgi:uncharacterized SAM-binding protein YcdF (DUF218 family)
MLLLSKLVALFLKPLLWVCALALWALWARAPRRRRRLARLAVAALLIFTNPGLINLLAAWWEKPYRGGRELTGTFDVGIVLGGYIDFEASAPPGLITLHRAGNRLTSALALYHSGRIERILLSGGAGRIIGSAPPEALVARQFLLQAGVPDSAILVEVRSRNTRENAAFSRPLIDRLAPGASCLLITSAWHLRRAEGSFARAGIRCQPFGTDFLTEQSSGNPLRWLEPNWKALMKWELLLKEWVGWVAYRF